MCWKLLLSLEMDNNALERWTSQFGARPEFSDCKEKMSVCSCHSVNVVIHSNQIIVYLPVMGQLCLKIITFPWIFCQFPGAFLWFLSPMSPFDGWTRLWHLEMLRTERCLMSVFIKLFLWGFTLLVWGELLAILRFFYCFMNIIFF